MSRKSKMTERKLPIVIEKGKRIQYCMIAEILHRDDSETCFRVIGHKNVQVVTNQQFDRWF